MMAFQETTLEDKFLSLGPWIYTVSEGKERGRGLRNADQLWWDDGHTYLSTYELKEASYMECRACRLVSIPGEGQETEASGMLNC